jgi:hypothetical protein
MMTPLSLAPLDGAHRIRLDELEWAALLALTPDFTPPPWLDPLVDTAPVAAVEPDAALTQALTMQGRALVSIEVAATSDRTGLAASLWTDGSIASSVVRATRVDPTTRPEAKVQPLPGVEISAYPIGTLLDEIIRLIPPSRSMPREPVEVPEEFSVALARAIHHGDGRLVETIAGDLGWSELPSTVSDLAAGITGHLLVSVTSRSTTDVSVGSWVLTRGGWVQLQRTETGHIRHTPCSADDVRALLLSSLTGRLGAEIDRLAADGGPR